MSDNYEQLLKQGDEALEQGNFELAMQCFERCLELAPDSPEPYHKIGRVHGDSGDREKAKEYYHKALERDGSYWRSLNNLAIIYRNENNYSLALQYAEAALKSNPERPQILMILGNIHGAMKDYKQCRIYLQKALEMDPNLKEAKLNYAEVLIRLNQDDQAIMILEELTKDPPLNRKTRTFYDLAISYVNLNCYGTFHNEIDFTTKLVDILESCIEHNTEEAYLTPDELYYVHNELGEAYYGNQLYQKALDNYLCCLNINPTKDAKSAHLYIACAYTYLKDYSKAEEYFKKVFSRLDVISRPEEIEDVAALAFYLYRAGQYKELINVVEPVYDQIPNHHLDDVTPWMASACGLSEEYEKAIPYCERYILLNPEDPWGYRALGSAFEELERWEDALNAITPTFESEFINSKLCKLASRIYAKLGNEELSEQYRQKALELEESPD